MRRLQKIVLTIGVLLLVLGQHVAALAEMVAITGEEINMRSGPGTKNEVLWKISSGFPLEVVKRSGEWLQVKDFEGSVGWVQKNTVNSAPHMIVKANKETDEKINIRAEANGQSKVVAQAKYGVVFKTVNKKGSWINVEHQDGVKGWVENSLLWGF